MSFLRRFFRKAPPPAQPEDTPPESADVGGAQPSVPDRDLLAAADAESLQQAIEQRDAARIATLVLEGASTRIRQLAAEAIEDPAQLRQLIKDVRGGNDKSVYRILTRKRDALLAQTRQTEQLHAEIATVAAAIERHSQKPYDPLFAPTLEQLRGRWEVVAADAGQDLAQSVEDALQRAREIITSHARQLEVEVQRRQAVAHAAAEAERLRDLAEQAAAAAAAEQARIREAQLKEAAEKQEAQALALRQISGLVRMAHAALRDGGTSRAAGLRRAIDEKLPVLPGLPAHLSRQLQQLDAKLAELKDWKSFTVAPKRAELIQEMESLAGSTLDPPALAQRIRALQADWRTLSKGAGENLEGEWQRFQEAAQKAYQPCSEYYEAQALSRQENLQRRMALVARLSAFEAGHNWEHPDWHTVALALRESKQQWRRHSPVDRAAAKAVQEQFAATTASLQSRLDAEHARNVKEKRLLIERALRLIASEDSRKAIDDIKGLQQQWRGVGPVPREQEQPLWEEFRQQCDAVFQKRQQEFAEYTAGLEANRIRGVALCGELEAIAVLAGAQLLERAEQLSAVRRTFEELGEFPKASARELRGRFERGLEQCEEAVARQRASDAELSWIDLLGAADRVRAYRLATIKNADAAECEVLRSDVEGCIAGVSRWPKGGLAALRGELARVDATDFAANEAALRKLCIRAEVLAQLPSPLEDQAARREYQVQRLVQSMGQGLSADPAELDAMAIEWIGVGPTEAATYQPLLERFMHCRHHSLMCKSESQRERHRGENDVHS